MRIGILADIHEDGCTLALALAQCRAGGVDRVVVLGDVFDTGGRLAETAALLAGAGAIGVWGNHDLGLCHDPEPSVRARYAGPAADFMATLGPRLEVGGCLFVHGLPDWDPTDPAVYYLGDGPETAAGRAASFAAFAHPVCFVGHFHCWLAATPGGLLPWVGAEPLVLHPDDRWLVVVHAVCDGWWATYDTDTRLLTPRRLAAGL